MRMMKLNFHSIDLGIHTKVNVILPTGRPVFYQERQKELYQVLWLLHGGTDDCNDFIQNTNICRYAEENKVAVVLPEDNDAFFTDGYIPNGGLYFSYVTEELVRMCRSILPLSPKREDNFVAGPFTARYALVTLSFAKYMNVYEIRMNTPILFAQSLIRANAVRDLSVLRNFRAYPSATASLYGMSICPIMMNIPFSAPHMKKVRFAPCHIPLTKSVMKMFRYFLTTEHLLPPRGIYR